MHDFQKSLKIGQAGEAKFFKKYSKQLKLILQDGFLEDFQMGRDKEKVELKSDSYDATKTPYFFMERYYDVEKKKDGGPWRALNKQIEHFIYYFPKNDLYYLFNTEELVDYLNVKIRGMKPIRILNRAWITTGFKILRSDLDHLNKAN